MITHPGARYAGPVWLLAGLVVFVTVRRRSRRGLFEHVSPIGELPPGTDFQRILVPMKLGDIGEEMVATAIALAKDRGGAIEAITVVRVPRKFELEGDLPEPSQPAWTRRSTRPARSAQTTASRCTPTSCARARSATRSSTRPRAATPTSSCSARRRGGGGSPGSSRRPSTSSLRHAPCEVLVVAFPDGTFEE